MKNSDSKLKIHQKFLKKIFGAETFHLPVRQAGFKLFTCLSGRQALNSPFRCGRTGFTLIELLVTISIFTAISLAMFTNYPRFRENISLKRTAQKIALSVRQAQVYGLSVKEIAAGSRVFPGYGVHFAIDRPKSFILFKDIDNGNDYDGEAEKDEQFIIQTNDKISDLCGNRKTFPPGSCGLTQLDIVYLRPKSDVTLKGEGSNFADAEVVIKSPNGAEKTIVIWSTGRIGVE